MRTAFRGGAPRALAALAFAGATLGVPALAITLDGRLDPEYGPALSVQTTATYPLDNQRGHVAWSDGSELDALHAVVEGGTLYLFLAGNQYATPNPSDPGFFADHLHVFFDTRPGGQQVLRSDNFDVGPYPGHSVLANMAGLAFEPGFEADWWFGEILFDPEITYVAPPRLFAWRAELLTAGGGPGEYLGETAAGPTAGLDGGVNPLAVRAAFDNSNVAGVPLGCAASSGAGVDTGIEWAIPLEALGNPEGCVRVVAFFSYKGAHWGPNQALPPLPTGLCSVVSPVSALDFGALAGDQSLGICGTSTPAARGTWGRIKTLRR